MVECVDLRHGRVDIGGSHRRHALHGDRVPVANRDGANLDRARWIAFYLHLWSTQGGEFMRSFLRSAFQSNELAEPVAIGPFFEVSCPPIAPGQ
jgi:hypothetical protein